MSKEFPLRRKCYVAGLITAAACAGQNPSPMVDSARSHERLQQQAVEGRQFKVEQGQLLVTPRAQAAGEADLLVHFHGSAWLPFQAALLAERALVVAALPRDFAGLDRLLDDIRAKGGVRINRLYLSGFSAGYGPIRAFLDHRPDAVAGVLLLDGLHAGYRPDRKLDTDSLEPFLRFAQQAVAGRKRFVFTHSEIFPGTFASTTETADYLIGELGLKRTPVLRWGPRGMQQISEVRSGGLLILGFAGNSAPDHVDHFHGMPEFLELLLGGSK